MLKTSTRLLLLLIFLGCPAVLSSAETAGQPETCTYTVSIWNTEAGKITRTERIEKRYSEVTDKERDRSETGCTVCMEDQVRLKLPGMDPFYACHLIAGWIEEALLELIQKDEPVFSVSGYRPVRSKGPLNASGERTELSNHAFGTAIDINRMQNGLYNNCLEWSDECELVLGGPWSPGKIEGSLAPDGAIVSRMKALGFKWGGELKASQKDFMHFSLSGF